MTTAKLRWTSSGVLLFALFLGLGVWVHQRPLPLDVTIADALRGEYTRPFGHVVGVVTNVFGPAMPIVLGVGLIVALFVRHEHAKLLLKLLALLVVCRVTDSVFKPIFDRQRPRVYPDWSYPSGHVTSVASTGLVAVVLCVWLAPRLVRGVAAAAGAATVVSAACRIVLGVHWLTDTVGAVLAVTGAGLVAAAVLGLLPGPRDGVISDG
jgi:membrane-associated phospholipid phosphatase